MEFRIATAQDTPHVENLWAYCFEPKEDPFFQYYFTNCYEPEHTMVGLEQDQLLSTVHLRQYNLNVRGAVLPTSYMVGVATHPAARRGGVGGAFDAYVVEACLSCERGDCLGAAVYLGEVVRFPGDGGDGDELGEGLQGCFEVFGDGVAEGAVVGEFSSHVSTLPPPYPLPPGGWGCFSCWCALVGTGLVCAVRV